ncbi:hypothetical protein D6833_07400, partial [Candidatus Parcubacteria bacterium]
IHHQGTQGLLQERPAPVCRRTSSAGERLPQDSAAAFFKDVSLRAGPDERPFEHPYHWAGFVYLGLPIPAHGE